MTEPLPFFQLTGRGGGAASSSGRHALSRQASKSLAVLPTFSSSRASASSSFNFIKNFSLPSAQKFLIDSVLRRVTNTQAAVLRRKTAEQLSSGHRAPFLALVGVGLASGTGTLDLYQPNQLN